MKKVFIVGILLFTLQHVKGQNAVFKKFGQQKNLPGHSVHKLFLSSANILWVGTNNGIAFYSRGKFVIPSQPKALATSHVMDFSEDDLGRIWVINVTCCITYFGATIWYTHISTFWSSMVPILIFSPTCAP